jgi:uncharacterized protein YjiS (DUF1127 family)
MSTLALRLSHDSTYKTFGMRIRSAYRALRAYRERRLGMRSLESMEDHLLKDIGIGRSEIGLAVMGLIPDRRSRYERTAV